MIGTVQFDLPFRRSIAFIRLSAIELEWALDHSRREFLVRESVSTDHPFLADLDEEQAEAIRRGWRPFQSVTVIRLRDGRKWVFACRTVRFPGTVHWPQGWKNTDEYARARLVACERAKAKKLGGAK
jgi:hypothetical protein